MTGAYVPSDVGKVIRIEKHGPLKMKIRFKLLRLKARLTLRKPVLM